MLRFYHASKESATPHLVFSRLQFHQTSGSTQQDQQVPSVPIIIIIIIIINIIIIIIIIVIIIMYDL